MDNDLPSTKESNDELNTVSVGNETQIFTVHQILTDISPIIDNDCKKIDEGFNSENCFPNVDDVCSGEPRKDDNTDCETILGEISKKLELDDELGKESDVLVCTPLSQDSEAPIDPKEYVDNFVQQTLKSNSGEMVENGVKLGTMLIDDDDAKPDSGDLERVFTWKEGDLAKYTPSRRTSTNKLMHEEEFISNIYEGQKAGFTTARPSVWLIALRSYIENENIICRCEWKKDKNDKLTECNLLICFKEVKQVTILINFNIGVF